MPDFFRKAVAFLLRLKKAVKNAILSLTEAKAQVIREVLADKGVSFFYNPFYDVTNSIASAWFAKEFLMGDDLLIMNGDVYLEEKLLDRILAQGRSPVMFADESRRETADYKFFYEDGILKKYGKELTCDKSSPIDSLGRGSHKVWVKRKE